MLKKLLVLLVLPFLLIPFLCGCQEKSDKTVLTFSSWGSLTETQILENVIKNYENDNPNIKINFLIKLKTKLCIDGLKTIILIL